MPVLGLMFLITAVIGVLMLQRTRFGRSMYLIGSNPRAARIAGFRSAPSRFWATCYRECWPQ